MPPNHTFLRRLLRVVVVTALLSGTVQSAAPAFAASGRTVLSFAHNSGTSGTDDPCAGHQGRLRGQSGAAGCPDNQSYPLHGVDRPRQPGSSAFGLQFNSGDY